MSSEPRKPLTADQRRALHAAAEAGGFSEGFGDLLCQLAEIVGFDEISTELERVKRLLAGEPADGSG